MDERFTVVSITGYAIAANGKQSTSRAATEWYVLDRAWNHRVVARFKGFAAKLRAERRAASLTEQQT